MSTKHNVTRGAGREEHDQPQRLSRDDLFHLLQNSRRRAVLRYLFDQSSEGIITMREAAEEVAAWENDTEVAQLTSDRRQRVYIALYQSHLPKLHEYGVIEYDQSRGTVQLTPLAEAFKPYLRDGLRAKGTEDEIVDEQTEATSLRSWLISLVS